MIGLDINKSLDRLFEIEIIVLEVISAFSVVLYASHHRNYFLYLTTVSGKPSVS